MKTFGARSGADRRRTAPAVAAAALAASAAATSVLAAVGPAASADAAGSCHRGGCTGRDPQAVPRAWPHHDVPVTG
ncbi:hypothetical protein [Streptomyces sp. HPF1205]|uniref:hypothetical protein n=1 Tax=Streptomyces sp. HPF1205 TaxID=2873262 RepID=UPI001CED6BC7|nr:hypothetical protein [Streptomyces sp. HPF1205]